MLASVKQTYLSGRVSWFYVAFRPDRIFTLHQLVVESSYQKLCNTTYFSQTVDLFKPLLIVSIFDAMPSLVR